MAAGGFDALYHEGMGLIEEVAAYLDGDGRDEAKALPREASFVYATESMRLTTRLMQLASWLLLHRAVSAGELSVEQAREEKAKVKFSALPSERGGPGWEALPERMLAYIARGDSLFERVTRFESAEKGEGATAMPAAENAVNAQLDRLKAAFGR
nr:DUF1465 family protein [Pelagibacterium montanilacus]